MFIPPPEINYIKSGVLFHAEDAFLTLTCFSETTGGGAARHRAVPRRPTERRRRAKVDKEGGAELDPLGEGPSHHFFLFCF